MILTHESTRETGLFGDWNSTSCVLSSGDVVLYDKESNGGNWNLHFFSPERQLVEHEARTICEHYQCSSLLVVIIGNTEYIAVSCIECDMISLVNAQNLSQEPVVAYRGKDGEVGPMCLGSTGTLYVVGRFNGKVSLLDCTSTKFTLKRKLCVLNDLSIGHICHMEDHDLIVLSSYSYDGVAAVSSSDGQIVWFKSHVVSNPMGLAFLCDRDLLLVGDGTNERIQILSPNTGNVLQTVPLLQKTWWINDLHLINNKLLVHHGHKLFYYSVSVC